MKLMSAYIANATAPYITYQVTEVPTKTRSCTENFLYKKAEAVKVPKTEANTANQALICVAYRTALSIVVLVKILIPLRIGKVTTTNRNPSMANDIILYSLLYERWDTVVYLLPRNTAIIVPRTEPNRKILHPKPLSVMNHL